MKLRHLASFAAVGWYLMAPPAYKPDYRVEVDAPISDWDIIDSFDTAVGCETRIGYLQQHPSTDSNTAKAAAIDRRVRAALCIATDDPRLKPKPSSNPRK